MSVARRSKVAKMVNLEWLDYHEVQVGSTASAAPCGTRGLSRDTRRKAEE
jgi:hypothetical protein